MGAPACATDIRVPVFGLPRSTPSKFKLSAVCGGCTRIVKKADAADMLDVADAVDVVDG